MAEGGSPKRKGKKSSKKGKKSPKEKGSKGKKHGKNKSKKETAQTATTAASSNEENPEIFAEEISSEGVDCTDEFEGVGEGKVVCEKPKEKVVDTGRNRSGKPQIWIRLRPSPRAQDNIFDVTNDGKGIEMISPPCQEEKNGLNLNGGVEGGGSSKKRLRREKDEASFAFNCDGVLKNVSQEDVYQSVGDDLVCKAMEGISGLILSVGAKESGKYFTLFGPMNKFQYRGIIPRCLERIFQICHLKSDEMRYLIRMAVVEIRNDKILDLLTLQYYEGHALDVESKNGMIFQKIGAAEHGFGLLIRALTCQKEIPREAYTKPHTLVFIDIYGESCSDGLSGEEKPNVIKSRITFAKTAPVPESHSFRPSSTSYSADSENDLSGCQDRTLRSGRFNSTAPPSSFASSCCEQNSCGKKRSGPLVEAIRIRKDLSYLERLCSQARKYQRLNQYYNRLAKVGIAVKAPRQDHHFRSSKLTYCLKDIISGEAEIRLILHIRSEKNYRHLSLETLRFGDKVRFVPYGRETRTSVSPSPAGTRTEVGLRDFLNNIPPNIADLFIQAAPCGGNSNVGIAFFDGALRKSEGLKDSQVQELFKTFRLLWNNALETGGIPSFLLSSRGRDNEEMYGEIDSNYDTLPSIGANNPHFQFEPEEDLRADLYDVKGLRGSDTTGNAYHQAAPHALEQHESKEFFVSPDDHFSSKKGDFSGEDYGEGYSDYDCYEPRLENLGGEDLNREAAWAKFMESEKGNKLRREFRFKKIQLVKTAGEQADSILEMSATSSRLNTLQAELNLIQQERFLKGDEYDSFGNIVIASREKELIQSIKALEDARNIMATKLQNLKTRLLNAKQALDSDRMELDSAFADFTMENYAMTYPSGSRNRMELEDELDSCAFVDIRNKESERIKKFEEIKKIAKRQARLFMKAVAQKPSWVAF